MRPLLIVSDSHGNKDELEELFKAYKGYTIIHLGDYCIDEELLHKYNVIYVKGNCDFSKANSEEILDLDNTRILITHGNKYDVKNTYNRLYYKALEVNVNYVFFGHTHRESNFTIDNITFLNPGSFKSDRSYITIKDSHIKFHKW